MNDVDQLVNSAKAGDNAAFGELVRLFERSVWLSAFRVLRDYQAAEDVTQETFVIAHRKLGELRNPTAIPQWLLRISRREAVHRSKLRIVHRTLGEASDLAVQMRPVSPLHEALVEAIGRLPEHERLVTVLHYLDGHSAAEVSRLTGRTVGTVTKQLSRAVRRLKRILQQELVG